MMLYELYVQRKPGIPPRETQELNPDTITKDRSHEIAEEEDFQSWYAAIPDQWKYWWLYDGIHHFKPHIWLKQEPFLKWYRDLKGIQDENFAATWDTFIKSGDIPMVLHQYWTSVRKPEHTKQKTADIATIFEDHKKNNKDVFGKSWDYSKCLLHKYPTPAQYGKVEQIYRSLPIKSPSTISKHVDIVLEVEKLSSRVKMITNRDIATKYRASLYSYKAKRYGGKPWLLIMSNFWRDYKLVNRDTEPTADERAQGFLDAESAIDEALKKLDPLESLPREDLISLWDKIDTSLAYKDQVRALTNHLQQLQDSRSREVEPPRPVNDIPAIGHLIEAIEKIENAQNLIDFSKAVSKKNKS